MHKIQLKLAQFISIIFHPLLIPTIGFLLLFNSGFYFSFLPSKIEQYILLVVFISTCVLPLLSIGVLALKPGFDIKMEKSNDRILPLMFSAVFYYFAYLLLKKLPVYPIYTFFIIASILIQIALLLISLRWKISAHAAAIGGLLGGFFALSFRLFEYPLMIIVFLIISSGFVASARLILQKHDHAQVISGFALGFLIMNLSILFL